MLGFQAGQPRTEKMPVDQDWTSVYPTAAPFRPSSVPLPVRMGYPVRGGVPPEKKGNLELIKVGLHFFFSQTPLFVITGVSLQSNVDLIDSVTQVADSILGKTC